MENKGENVGTKQLCPIAARAEVNTETKVDEFDLSLDGEHHIGAFQIAVREVPGMEILQRLQDLVRHERDVVLTEAVRHRCRAQRATLRCPINSEYRDSKIYTGID